ncbi:MAG: BatA domain-containing protein [Planctomycetota bacterium]|nr:BatA domain-containing protein [Planctomycetota bacterium]
MLPVEFLHQTLLIAGGLALSIPVALHLLTRRKPLRMRFPAVRFLQQKQAQTHRQLQIRHWLLLMLRCLLLGLLALLLSRPRVATSASGISFLVLVVVCLCVAAGGLAALLLWGERQGRALTIGTIAMLGVAVLITGLVYGFGSQRGALWRDEEEPVAAAIVVDTAPYMDYLHASETRLQLAQKMAAELLSQFPAGSEIGIVDSHGPVGLLSPEKGSVERTLKGLRLAHFARPVRELVKHGITMVTSSQLSAKELYLFSDLGSLAWDQTNPQLWDSVREESRSLSIQVLDVGIQERVNVALNPVRLVPEVVSAGQTVQVVVDVEQLGPARDVQLELALEQPQADLPVVIDGQVRVPTLIGRDLRTVSLDANGSSTVSFELKGLPQGTHHGVVRLRDLEDGLAGDNLRYFSLLVRNNRRILLVSWDVAARDTMDRLLLAAGFGCDVVDAAQLESVDDSSYDAMCWIDPPPLPPAVWRKATKFVERGGGILIALGPRARPPEQFSSQAALALTPAANVRVWNAVDPLALQVTDVSHRALAWVEPHRSVIPWSAFPVFQHWYVGSLQPDSQIVATYNQGQPAILDRAVGKGHVVMLTTPLGQSQHDRTEIAWNRLLLGENDDWPTFTLVVELFEYLTDSTSNQSNFMAGESVRLAWKNAPESAVYQLFTPDDTWQSLTAENDGSVRLPFVEVPGVYRLKSLLPDSSHHGFSINLSGPATQLARSEPEELVDGLQLADWQFSRAIPELRRNVRLRGSYEAYAPLLVLLAVVLACEHVAANRFYAVRGESLGSSEGISL